VSEELSRRSDKVVCRAATTQGESETANVTTSCRKITVTFLPAVRPECLPKSKFTFSALPLLAVVSICFT
jgi:hypothetical protein